MDTISKQKIFDGLVARCQDFKSSRFIMSDITLMQLLKYIVSYRELSDIVVESRRIADYNEEFAKATAAEIPKLFKLPSDDRRLIVLVTGLLYEFDRETINMNTFIREYFSNLSIDSGFDAFCDNVLREYTEAFRTLLFKPQSAHYEDEESEADNRLSDKVVETLTPMLVQITENVIADRSLSDKKRTELIDVLEGLYYILEDGNGKLLKAMWTGVKNTFIGTKNYNSTLNAIDEILISYKLY